MTLELRGLHKSYGAAAVLAGVDLTVAAGSRTAIVGPSGSGKSTLLRVIAGFESPDAGSVALAGRRLVDDAVEVPAHRRAIGFVPQDGALFPHLSIADNIGFGLAGDRAARARRIGELMEMVALDRTLLARRPHELSGGQQQRVALARALAQRPRLMLLDEPFSALDAGLRAATRKAAAQLLAAAGVTTILVTHDQAEALSFADQLAVLRNGRLAQAGTPHDLYRHPGDEQTAAFLGEAIVLTARIANGRADCALGRVPVAPGTRDGIARILLRPEQLRLADDADPAGCRGVVVDVDFGGASSLLTIRLANDGAPSLLVRSAAAPPPGTPVRIAVSGAAHVFDPAR